MTSDSRTPAEHDCDRILYSDEFRRLGEVTQVVAVGEMPLFHTRLTHTLKVQQMSRRMAEHLVRDQANRERIDAAGGLDVAAAEAGGMAHDLGHPPFGHVGEQSLNRLCEAQGLDGFEGNAQTFRILTKLACRDTSNPFGLELSRASRRAVIKYPWLRSGAHEGDEKWNAYPTESGDFADARTGLADERVSLEAAVMDWADDITYAVHDLEDFVRAGRVPIHRLAGDDEELAAFVSRAKPRLSKRYPLIDWDKAAVDFATLAAALFAQFSHRGNLPALRSTSRYLINRYASGIELSEPGDVSGPLNVPNGLRSEIEFLKQLTWYYVIHDPALATLQEGQQRVIEGLFEKLFEWLGTAESTNTMFRLPARLVELFQITATEPGHEAYANPAARKARAVADYIASLTESQTLDLYERLTGTGTHSVLDPWLVY